MCCKNTLMYFIQFSVWKDTNLCTLKEYDDLFKKNQTASTVDMKKK
jgi:hypothetical protein